MLRPILVTTDVSRGSVPALLRAKVLPDSFGARLTVLHVLGDSTGSTDRQRTEGLETLESHLADVLQDTAKVEACIRAGDPFEEILDCVGSGRPAQSWLARLAGDAFSTSLPAPRRNA